MKTIIRLLETDTYVEGIERDWNDKITGVVVTSNAFKAKEYDIDSPTLYMVEDLSYLSSYSRDVHNTMLEFVRVL